MKTTKQTAMVLAALILTATVAAAVGLNVFRSNQVDGTITVHHGSLNLTGSVPSDVVANATYDAGFQIASTLMMNVTGILWVNITAAGATPATVTMWNAIFNRTWVPTTLINATQAGPNMISFAIGYNITNPGYRTDTWYAGIGLLVRFNVVASYTWTAETVAWATGA